ncbi:hypothetical protein D3C71_1794390 [compost metagenome]
MVIAPATVDLTDVIGVSPSTALPCAQTALPVAAIPPAAARRSHWRRCKYRLCEVISLLFGWIKPLSLSRINMANSSKR